jgi:hypothetical protein
MTQKNWSEEEFEGIDLGDERLNKRIIKLADRLEKQPEGYINQACEDWADAKAAYRFFDNEKVKEEEIIRVHQNRTQERMKGSEIVLAIQDTTEFDYTKHPKTRGLGQVGNGASKSKGLMMHSTLAITTKGLPLGVLTQEIWARKENKEKKKGSRQIEIKDKESYKWINAMEQIQEMRVLGTEIIMVCDREADVFEFLLRAEQLSAGFLVRAYWDRFLEGEENTLFKELESTEVVGKLEIDVASKINKKTKIKEEKRTAKVEVRFSHVEIKPPQIPKNRQMQGWKPIKVWAVYVKEFDVPENATALEWMLLTNIAVNSFSQALERIEWYCLRWQIEVYHKLIKSGCRVEDCLLETADRLKRYLALMCVIAWRLFWLTYLKRQYPDSSCTTFLTQAEWQVLYCKINNTLSLPLNPPTVSQAVTWIAQLGGFLARKHDGEPGITVIWRGWQRLQSFVDIWLLFNPSTYG